MKRNTLLGLLCLVFLAAAFFGGREALSIALEYREGEETYKAMERYVSIPTTLAAEAPTEETPAEEAVPAETPPTDDTLWPEVDFEALKAVNGDVVGWLYLEGTKINYPVVQGEDNTTYISQTIDGKYNGAGTLFVDYRLEGDFSEKHTIIYGHHMNNGSMFACLTDYKDQAFYDQHPTALLMTPEGNYTVELFSGYVASLSDEAWPLSFGTEEEYQSWLEQTKDKSLFESDIVPTTNDKVITLSTCDYEFADARFVVVGVIRE